MVRLQPSSRTRILANTPISRNFVTKALKNVFIVLDWKLDHIWAFIVLSYKKKHILKWDPNTTSLLTKYQRNSSGSDDDDMHQDQEIDPFIV